MSAAQILEELPKLTRHERKQIMELAWSLNVTDEPELEWANACAVEGFQMLDKMEAEDEALRKAR
jgi:hypothetical protein